MADKEISIGKPGYVTGGQVVRTMPLRQPGMVTSPVELTRQPENSWVFRTYSIGGWDYDCNPVMVMLSVELVKDEQNGKLVQSNLIFDFVDPKQPSRRVCVMTESMLEAMEEVKAAYTMERLASQGKK